MNLPDLDWRLVFTAIGAALFRAWTSEDKSFVDSAIIVVFSLFSAWVFTDPLVWLIGWPRETFVYPACALATLTGERLMRVALKVAEDPTRAIDFWKAWRGK